MKIEVVTAPEHRYFTPDSLKLFLAGGICKCAEWQKQMIDLFIEFGQGYSNSIYDTLYVLNPRRVDWIDEPGAAERQVEWEFDMLERCDVFTMYFAGGESDQPICMYELGRNIERFKERFPNTWKDRIFITCDKSYKRLNDVLIQTRLATDGKIKVTVSENDSIDEHFNNIMSNLKYITPESYVNIM